MSTRIIAALRQNTQLKGNTFLIATELAHRMNSRGCVRVSYQFLAWKAHCCKKTAMTHVQKLLTIGLFTKHVTRTYYGYDWNRYAYTGPWPSGLGPPDDDRIHALRAMPYQTYLQTPEWQATRTQALYVAYHRCQVCNTRKECLDVHHRDYSNLGEEWLSQLVVLCRSCHKLFHIAGKLVPSDGPLQDYAKESSLREDVERQRKGLRLGLYTPGSDLWHKTCEEIARLEAVVKGNMHGRPRIPPLFSA